MLNTFYKSQKCFFKITAAQIDLYGIKKKEVFDDILPTSISPNDCAVLKRFKNFLIMCPRTKNSQFIQKLKEKNVKSIEVVRSQPTTDLSKLKYVIYYAKNINLII